uniref:Uncharacterized protein n=1 Tax=Knipowitschia caucasica TaxID=637954 RepID=A0AAV2MIP4_KNICA
MSRDRTSETQQNHNKLNSVGAFPPSVTALSSAVGRTAHTPPSERSGCEAPGTLEINPALPEAADPQRVRTEGQLPIDSSGLLFLTTCNILS